MNAQLEVIRLRPLQKEMAVETLNRAFLDDVGYAFVIPDRIERDQALRRFWNALITHCSIYGEIYTTSDVAGVACWLCPGKTAPTIWQMIRTGFALPRAAWGFGKEGRERIAPLMRHNDEVHARAVSGVHWYLGALAVDPTRQRVGIGSRLLQPVLSKADEQRLPCFVETQTDGNVQFYEKLGFVVVNAEEVAGTGLKMWAMLRQPRLGQGLEWQ